MSTVIVFGPTGGVGSVVARTAQEQGAAVVLAMRDPQKAIPGLDSHLNDQFKRVQADLSDADSVSAAVKQTGAKRAFFYLAHGTSDHMLSSIKALKTGGVEFVVFLSSYTIKNEAKDVPPSEIIPFVHAKVELSLDEVFGPENYVALRPGGFASNLLRYKQGIQSGNVEIHAPGFLTDSIVPADIGCVGGMILVYGPQKAQRKVYLYGPEVIPQGDAIERIGKVLGKALKISPIDEKKALDNYLGHGIPKPVADYIIRRSTDPANEMSDRPSYTDGVNNVKLYTGRPAERLEDWITQNKEVFLA